jgi:5'-nucleotidase
MKRLLAAALLFAPLACRTAAPAPMDKAVPAAVSTAPIHLTLVGTNDLHGWVQPHDWQTPDGQPVREGGLAAFAGYLANLRADNPDGVVLLDAGDLFQGTLVSNLTEGQVVIDLYNRLGYRAAAIGNHEFDYGPVGPISVATQAGLDPFGALKQRLAQAQFPMLGTNLYDAHTGARPAWLPNDGTALFTVKGVKVGVLGLTTPSTPETTNPVNVSTLRFGSLVPEALAAAHKLRQEGAQVVIAVSHAGGRCLSIADPHDLSSCDRKDGEIFDLLDGLPEGTLDAVIAGHTHATIGQFVHGTPVIETPGMGRAFGTIDLYLDPANHQLLTAQTRIQADIPVCPVEDAKSHRCDPFAWKGEAKVQLQPARYLGRPVVVDSAIEKSLAPALARVEAEQRRPLGIPVPKALPRDYQNESALGDVLADSLRAMDHADVALLNPGGLRAELPAGELTFGGMYEVIPFDNTVATLTVNGEQLTRLIGAAYNGHKGVFQQSGLQIRIAPCPGHGRLKSAALENGAPIDPSAKYRVVVPDFLARGGDGLGAVVASLPKEDVDLGMSRPLGFRDALVAYWQSKHATLVAPSPGRVRFVPKGATCPPPGAK